MTDEVAFPQDWGTGLDEEVDWVDAGAFAFHNDHPNLRGYVVHGFEFTPDYTNNLVTISAGKAHLYESATSTNDHRDDGGPDAYELEGAVFTMQRDVSGDRTLSDGENYIYLAVDQNDNDATDYYINTTGTAPPGPYILLGRVDTVNETVHYENRHPSASWDRNRVTGETDWTSYV